MVWWALPLGGLLGAVARLIIAGGFDLPYWAEMHTTGQRVWIPGFIGDIVLGVTAAFVVGGLSASTFDFQGGFDSRGFWGPFIASISAGLAASQLLTNAASHRLEEVKEDIVRT